MSWVQQTPLGTLVIDVASAGAMKPGWAALNRLAGSAVYDLASVSLVCRVEYNRL
jgi:hypothetical protein